ncbi:MAG: T9SS type A sorting domain-containing protein [Candidatus Marinimicrobia bacterium]|nr:T9SS type A sorting domain-containing protein [Candidatus Neomarinimicrobiota bacterium]
MNKKLMTFILFCLVLGTILSAYDSADNYKPANYVPAVIQHEPIGPQYAPMLVEPLSVQINSINIQKWPFVYLNVNVDTNGAGINSLDKNNFEVYEDGILQSDLFDVLPPASGEGNRLADFIFVLDVSGSMGEEIEAVRQNMSAFLDALANSGINYNVGFVVFADPHYVYNDGFLYSDKNQIQSVIDNMELGEHDLGLGGDIPEDQLDALVSASAMNFRPGAQRVAIMITDAPAHTFADVNGKWTNQTVDSCIEELMAQSITVYPVFATRAINGILQVNVDKQIEQYIPIAQATQTGLYFDVWDPFDEILNTIYEVIANTYLVRYYSNNNRTCDYDRFVDVIVDYRLEQNHDTISYTIGAVPMIERTQATLQLHNSSRPENVSFNIDVTITDDVAPFTQSAELLYKTSTGTSFKTMAFTYISDNLWRATVPAADVDFPGFDYYITATDGQFTSTLPSMEPYKNPFQLAVGTNELPVVDHTPLESYSYLNTAIAISANVTDATDNVDRVELYYKKYGQLLYDMTEMTKSGGNTYLSEIPSNIVTTDGFEYFIKAADNHNVARYVGDYDAPIFVRCALTPPGHFTAELIDSTDGLVELKWRKEINNGGFYEDFGDTLIPEWKIVTGQWHVADGNFNTSNSTHQRNSVYYNDYFENFVLEARMKRSGGSPYGIGLYFNGDPTEVSASGKWADGYAFTYCTAGNWDLIVYENGYSKAIQPLVCSSEILQGDNQWNILKVVYAYGYIDVYINHKLQGSYFDETHKRGRIGLHLHDDQLAGTAAFDYVTLTPLPDQYSFGTLQLADHQFSMIYDRQNQEMTTEELPSLKLARCSYPTYGLNFQYLVKNNAYLTEEEPTFKFFKVYRDNYCIAESHKSYYYDNLEVSGTYKYKVTSLYEEGESRPAGPAKIIWGEENIVGSTFSGNLLYLNSNEPLVGDTLELTGDLDNISITDANGFYQFKGLSSHTIVMPKKTGEIGSINGLDLLSLKNHLMGTKVLTNNSKKAADCNLDYNINGNDLLLLQNYLLGKTVSAPLGTWEFNPEKYEYEIIVGDMLNKNFTAFIYGDVNLSWNESEALAKEIFAHQTNLEFDDMYFSDGEYLYLPLTIDNSLKMAVIDWMIEYNPDELEFVGITGPVNFQSNIVDKGVKISWLYDGREITINENQALAELKFIIKSSANTTTVTFSGNSLTADKNENVYHINYASGKLNLNKQLKEVIIPEKTELFANYPNPFNPSTMIRFGLAEDAKVHLAIYDVRGRLVETLVNENKNAGYYTIHWDASKMASGVYIYKLQTNNYNDIKKCIFLK